MFLTKKQKFHLISFLSLFFVQHAQSETPPDDFFESEHDFISIATGTSQAIETAPAVASVVTAADIAKMGATSLEQILESVPGLHVSKSSIRLFPKIQIRGIGTDTNPQVLMLLNGIPLTHVYLGERGTLSADFPIDLIKRIEIIRGPGSAVFGADAFSGVINIIMPSSKDKNAKKAGVRVGSFDSFDTWLQWTGKSNDFHYLFSYQGSHTNGDKDRIINFDGQSLFDLAFNTNASNAPSSVSTDHKRSDLRLEIGKANSTFNIWHTNQKEGAGAGIALALDPNGYTDSHATIADFRYQNTDISEYWEIDFRLNYMDSTIDTNYFLFPENSIIPIGTDGNISSTGNPVSFPDGLIGKPANNEIHKRIEFSTINRAIKNHTLRFSVGSNDMELSAKEEKNFGTGVIDGTQTIVDGTLINVTGTPFVFIRDENRQVHYLSLQDEWRMFSDWILTAGLRYDKYSDFGETFNPRFALVWNANYNLTSKLLYGRAFRPPSFAELYAQNNPVVLGNEELEPETIDTLELSFDYRPDIDLRITSSFYYYQVKDLITFVPDSPDSSTARNLLEQDGKGLEVEVEWNISPDFELQTNYALQKSKTNATGFDIPDNPQQQFYITGQYKLDNWLFSSQLNYIADRKRLRGDPRTPIKNYTTVDFALKKVNLSSWTFGLIIANLFDSKRYEPSPANLDLPTGASIPGDFPLEGRRFSVEVEYQFK